MATLEADERAPTRVRPRLALVHRCIGLVLGAWVVLVGLTGSLLVFADGLEPLLHPDMLQATPTADGPLPLGDLVRSAQAAVPDEMLVRLRVPADAEDVAECVTDTGTHVYIDPYSGRVTGTATEYETLRGTLMLMHSKLLPGKVSHWLSAIPACVLLVLACSGFILHRPLRASLQRLKGGAAGRAFDLHNLVGSLFGPVLAIMACTGIALVVYQPREAPSKGSRADAVPPTPPLVAANATLDAMAAAALSRYPSAQLTGIKLPKHAQGSVVIRLRQPGDWSPSGRTFVIFADNGTALGIDDPSGMSTELRVLNVIYALHRGLVLPGRVLVLLAGLVPALLFVSGLLLARRRRRITASGTAGRAQPPPPSSAS